MMINPMMAVNPLLTVPGQQKTPLVPSAFEPPVVERDLLSSTIAPSDPRQFCISSQFGSSVLPNANMPNMLSHRVYSVVRPKLNRKKRKKYLIMPSQSDATMLKRYDLTLSPALCSTGGFLQTVLNPYVHFTIFKLMLLTFLLCGMVIFFFLGWGILPPESLKAMARRNEIIQRQHTARMEMEMHAIYQQRKIEKVNPTGLAGMGLPFFYGSETPAGSAPYHGRNTLPASDIHFHRSTLRNLSGNPMLVAAGSNFVESWRQKCRRLRRGTGNQKVLDSDTESCKNQAEEKVLDQTHAMTCEDNEYTKDPETETLNSHKSNETHEKTTTALANICGELKPTYRKPWGAQCALLEKEEWGGGKEKASEQYFATCDEKNRVCPPVHPPPLPGTHALVAIRGNTSLDEDIQKWTVNDVHNFIGSLPGCSDYAQVFKDHAIDGETLPLLTEEHLRSTMGLKLGPALKIQSQVSQHMQSVFFKKNLSHPSHTKETFGQSAASPLLDFSSWSDTLDIPCSQDIIAPKGIERDIMRN
ncbi:Sterile alpha motif domain-containing protein 7 [Galemys pyrenaicus]|uniref:Sterile alpha motif domain-containing protein 7 n=1 Tax=Galemys pyrenaicus TaxID=202257 RepID=A0A8J6AHH3_GALPY|nr:Sterile alpha motif domain-containing protein 7 [Galemys pyrenaicus]